MLLKGDYFSCNSHLGNGIQCHPLLFYLHARAGADPPAQKRNNARGQRISSSLFAFVIIYCGWKQHRVTWRPRGLYTWPARRPRGRKSCVRRTSLVLEKLAEEDSRVLKLAQATAARPGQRATRRRRLKLVKMQFRWLFFLTNSTFLQSAFQFGILFGDGREATRDKFCEQHSETRTMTQKKICSTMQFLINLFRFVDAFQFWRTLEISLWKGYPKHGLFSSKFSSPQ